MQFRNNGKGEDNIIRNHFTAYVKCRVERRKWRIIEKRNRVAKNEVTVDFESYFADIVGAADAVTGSDRDPMTWENERLVCAFLSLSKRDQTIIFAHVLDEATYDEIGGMVGMTGKGASTAYYRAVDRMRNLMKKEN